MTKYYIEKESGVYDARPVLERLVRLGLVITLSGSEPTKYSLNPDHWFVKALERFMRDVGYLEG